jgi:hypothetical protein
LTLNTDPQEAGVWTGSMRTPKCGTRDASQLIAHAGS